jgi:hypothetical protein
MIQRTNIFKLDDILVEKFILTVTIKLSEVIICAHIVPFSTVVVNFNDDTENEKIRM